MKIKINEIRKICEKILISRGVKSAEAKIVVDDYIEGELLGKNTHGLWAFISGYANVVNNKNQKMRVVKNCGNYALINGNRQNGQVIAAKARQLLVAKAKKFGVAMVGVYNAHTFLRPGTQAEYIAKKNLIGLIFHNGGGALMPPYGGIDPILSTDPIGYAIPTETQPLVLDMATSERAWSEIALNQTVGTRELSPQAFLDQSGHITTDSSKVFSVMPFGGAKGFALALLVEILSGSLVGNGVGLHKFNGGSDPYFKGKNKALRGTLFMAIDPSKFVSLKKFKKENSRLVKELKNARKRPGVKEILMPGESSYRNKQKCLKRGWFEVDKKIVDKIYELLET